MKPVNQKIVEAGRGDCHRAVIASLLDLELDQVPHFRLFDNGEWFKIYYHFMKGCGWEYEGSQSLDRGGVKLIREDVSVNGFFDATVKSKTFGEGITHAVVMDLNGIVVHDPNPNKLWEGINIVETGELKSWTMFSRTKPGAYR